LETICRPLTLAQMPYELRPRLPTPG